MFSLRDINDKYGQDSARGIVAYFLSNAGAWKGENAKKIKAKDLVIGKKNFLL